MGHVREHRSDLILEDTLLEWLKEGLIPTTGELQEALDSAETEFGDFTRSGLRNVTLPERWEESSSGLHNTVINTIEQDLDVILQSLTSISELGITVLGEWNSRGKNLEVRSANLKSRIESLLLLKSDTAGFVSFVEDGFLSLENVASDTTANVDTRTGEVSLDIDRSNETGALQGTQIDLGDSRVSWSLYETQNIKSNGRPSGSQLGNITTDKHSRYGTEVKKKKLAKFDTANTKSKAVVGELKVELAEQRALSKIVLITSDSNAGGNNVIACQYSVDSYTWENIPSESPVQSGLTNFIWRFPKTEMKWVKFIVSKATSDSNEEDGSLNDFGFEKLKVYSEIFNITTAGVDLVSETLTPLLGGSEITFGRVSLETCEEVPNETSIRYFVRAYDGSAFTNWIQVAPLSRDSVETPSIVDFSAPSDLSSEDLTTVFDSSLDTEALNILRVDGSSSLSYRFDGPDDVIANFYIEQSDTFLTDLILLRNAGYPEGKFPAVTTDLQVGDVECGWGLDGDSIYYCVFRVKRPGGTSIDLGPTQAVIDGSVASGVIDILPGWHTFRTDRANWGPLSGTVPTTVAGLKAIDPLYPYNHKYLIEGYNYPSTWTGEKVYLGTDNYGQYKATRIGRHDLTRREVDLSVYALDVITGPKTIVLLKFDSSRSNHKNERVRLFYTRRFDSFESVQFKATLKGTAERSPILSYYRIRVK
jgi:hypothetical protein